MLLSSLYHANESLSQFPRTPSEGGNNTSFRIDHRRTIRLSIRFIRIYQHTGFTLHVVCPIHLSICHLIYYPISSRFCGYSTLSRNPLVVVVTICIHLQTFTDYQVPRCVSSASQSKNLFSIYKSVCLHKYTLFKLLNFYESSVYDCLLSPIILCSPWHTRTHFAIYQRHSALHHTIGQIRLALVLTNSTLPSNLSNNSRIRSDHCFRMFTSVSLNFTNF